MKPRFILVTGENDSGKSLYAEALVRRIPLLRRVYIATMQPYGEEDRKRIEKHRAQRAGDGYETFEQPRHIERLCVGADAAVLLEDVTNLVANIVFDPAEPGGASEALAEIEGLADSCGALVAVTVRMPDGGRYAGETRAYIASVDAVNAGLIQRADAVVELQSGTPVWTKGALPW